MEIESGYSEVNNSFSQIKKMQNEDWKLFSNKNPFYFQLLKNYSLQHHSINLWKQCFWGVTICHMFHRWSVIIGACSYFLSVLCIQRVSQTTNPLFWTCSLWSLNYLFSFLKAFCSFCVKCSKMISCSSSYLISS